MPIKRRTQPRPNPKAETLLQHLVEEWKNPRETGEPIIIEEGGTQNDPTHIYVIWSEWGEFNQQERSEIIMDAYEQSRGKDMGLRVTVAMGLTPEEAERMKIHYE